eukprot:5165069-Amphidinium_carterae.1
MMSWLERRTVGVVGLSSSGSGYCWMRNDNLHGAIFHLRARAEARHSAVNWRGAVMCKMSRLVRGREASTHRTTKRQWTGAGAAGTRHSDRRCRSRAEGVSGRCGGKDGVIRQRDDPLYLCISRLLRCVAMTNVVTALIGQRCGGTLAGAGQGRACCGGRRTGGSVSGVYGISRGAGGGGVVDSAGVERKGR